MIYIIIRNSTLKIKAADTVDPNFIILDLSPYLMIPVVRESFPEAGKFN